MTRTAPPQKPATSPAAITIKASRVTMALADGQLTFTVPMYRYNPAELGAGLEPALVKVAEQSGQAIALTIYAHLRRSHGLPELPQAPLPRPPEAKAAPVPQQWEVVGMPGRVKGVKRDRSGHIEATIEADV